MLSLCISVCNNVDVPTLPLSSPLFAQNCIAIDQASNTTSAVISSSSNFVTTKRPQPAAASVELTSVVIHENHRQIVLDDDDDDVITPVSGIMKRTPLRKGGRSISRDFRPRKNNKLMTLNRACSEDNILTKKQATEKRTNRRRRHSIHSAHSGKF